MILQRTGGLFLIGLGFVIGGKSAQHIWEVQEPVIGQILGFLAIVAIAFPLLGGGIWLERSDTSQNHTDALRILGWVGAGMLPLIVFSTLIVIYEQRHGVTVVEPFTLITWLAGVGAVGGLLTGVYDIQRRRYLRRQRDLADRLSGIVEATPVPIIEHDLDGEVRRWNDAAERVFGWDADEAVGDRLPYLSEASTEEYASLRDRMLRGERLSNVEIRRQTKDGEIRDFLLSTAPIYRGEGDELTSIIGALVDVTEKKKRREQLELFRTLLDHSNDSIFVIDATTAEIIDANETAWKRLDFEREELLGQSVVDIDNSFSAVDEWCEHVETVRSEGSLVIESEHIRQDGSTFPVEINIAHATLDQTGERDYIVGIARDITDRKRRERERTRFREAIEHAGHAIYITDAEGTIEYVNPAFEEITGYASDEVIGQDPSMLQSGEHDEAYYRRLWTTIRNGAVWEEEIIDQRKSGELYTARQTIAPIYSGESLVGFVAIQTDVTDRHVRSEQVSVLNRVLRHNLRTAVNIIAGHADTLLTGFEEADHEKADERSRLATIKETARELEALSQQAHAIKQALDRTRPPARPTTIAELLARITERIDASGVDLTIEAPLADTISVDAAIQPALAELVENAIKHNDHSRPSLRIRVERNGDQVSIMVADDGPGIPEQDRSAIQEGGETALQHGSGLGLWLVKWVTTALGGKLAIDDNEPRGTIVTVTIPIVTVPEDISTDSDRETPTSGRETDECSVKHDD